MKRLALALVLIPGLAFAQEPKPSQAVAVNWANLQNAVIALIAENDRLRTEAMGYESRLTTAMQWLAEEQKKAAGEPASLKGGKAPQ
jgi:hypothetical protein